VESHRQHITDDIVPKSKMATTFKRRGIDAAF
jgi:hypothetical protein